MEVGIRGKAVVAVAVVSEGAVVSGNASNCQLRGIRFSVCEACKKLRCGKDNVVVFCAIDDGDSVVLVKDRSIINSKDLEGVADVDGAVVVCLSVGDGVVELNGAVPVRIGTEDPPILCVTGE